MKQENIQHLRNTISELNYCVSEDSINTLVQYHDLLMQQNSKYNLTGHKEEDVSVKMNLLNSIAGLKPVESAHWDEIADIGTGAGLPGIPWSILKPETTFYLVDNKPKKIKFLNLLIETLHLPNIKLVQSNVFELKRKYNNLVFQAFGKIDRVLLTFEHILNMNGHAYIFASDVSKIKPVLDSASEIKYEIMDFGISLLSEYTRVLVHIERS